MWLTCSIQIVTLEIIALCFQCDNLKSSFVHAKKIDHIHLSLNKFKLFCTN